jgi:DNA-binding transcriptional MerR regulator
MYYSIGEVANMESIPISTLRYYDKEGLFPAMERSGGGIRVFSDNEISALRVIECLKNSGMSIKSIKDFMDWCLEGDASLEKRQTMFHERLSEAERQMVDLQKTINTLKFKCWYYDTAIEAGTEAKMKELSDDDIPEELREYKI